MGALNQRPAGIEEQGPRLEEQFSKSGKGGDTIGSGIEGAWKAKSNQMGYGLFKKHCSKYEWELVKSPVGANQWLAKGRG